MPDKPPVPGVVPLSEMTGGDEQDITLLRAMAEDAKRYLASFKWCESIREVFFADGVGGIFAVFLARIKASRPDVDEWLWIIVGDIPPAYLVTDWCRNAQQAVQAYLAEMRKWVAEARLGRRSRDVIPVDLPATPEYAEILSRRLDVLEHQILPLLYPHPN